VRIVVSFCINVYVVADAGGWSIKRGKESSTILATHRSKDEAIAFAKAVAMTHGVEVVVVDKPPRDEK
jgi:hypothetical protein